MDANNGTEISSNSGAAERFSANVKHRATVLRWLLFSIKGRISRGAFFLSAFAIYGVPLCCYVVIQRLRGSGLADIADPASLESFFDTDTVVGMAAIGISAVLLIWINVAVSLKRAHDFNASYLILVGLGVLGKIPYIGWLFALAPFVIPGTNGPNKYGEGPGWSQRPNR